MGNVIKEIFVELLERFESTENLQAVETMLNYFIDYDFGLEQKDIDELNSRFCDVINVLNVESGKDF